MFLFTWWETIVRVRRISVQQEQICFLGLGKGITNFAGKTLPYTVLAIINCQSNCIVNLWLYIQDFLYNGLMNRSRQTSNSCEKKQETENNWSLFINVEITNSSTLAYIIVLKVKEKENEKLKPNKNFLQHDYVFQLSQNQFITGHLRPCSILLERHDDFPWAQLCHYVQIELRW